MPVPPREDFCLCFWGHLICSLHLLTISPDVVSLGPLCRLSVRAGNQCPPSLQFSSGGILPFSCFCVLGGALFQRAPPQQGLGTYVGPWAGFPIRLGSAGWLSSSMDTCPALSGEWVGLTASRGQGVLPGAVWQNHFSSRQVRAFLGLEGWISSLRPVSCSAGELSPVTIPTGDSESAGRDGDLSPLPEPDAGHQEILLQCPCMCL